MTSKAFSPENPSIPHLSKGELADLRGDVESGLSRLEANANGVYPQIDGINAASVSKAANGGALTDLIFTGSGFGTDTTLISATIGGVAATAQAGMTDTSMTLRITQGALAAVALGQMNVQITVDGVKCYPMTLTLAA